MALEALTAANGLNLCVYLFLRCPQCGAIRVAVEKAPEGYLHPCPICRRDAAFILMGEGGTQSALPFWERADYYLAEETDAIEWMWRGWRHSRE